MNKIRKGDEIVVIAGKDKGRRGTVTKVLLDEKKLLVDGINTVKKNTKADPQKGSRGGIEIKNMPIDWSNVMLYNTTTEKGSRVGMKKLEDGRYVRCFKSNDEVVDV
jgi:large subunit ribosomal protein L24